MSLSINSSLTNSNADTSWRRTQIPTCTTQPPSPTPLKSSTETTSPQRFKIDWPAPETVAKTQNSAACALPATISEPLPSENYIDIEERFKNINRRDTLIRPMDPAERRRNFPQATDDNAKNRNRYFDVLPTPLDLVTLTHPTNPQTSYINANKFHDMIITQGPLKNDMVDTVADFWTMAFEQGKDIICLTDHTGLSRNTEVEKTFPYWQTRTPSDPVVYKKQIDLPGLKFELEVKLIDRPTKACSSRSNNELVTKRVFQITLNGQVKQVTHWHFENWKDNCVCDHLLLARFIDLLSIPADDATEIPNEVFAEAEPKDPLLFIVHCSAGIGRSGVFAITKHFVDKYRVTGKWPSQQEIDAAILELRKRRPGSIQTKEQLELIQNTLRSYKKIGYVNQSG